MKKILPVVLIVLALAAGTSVYFFQKPKLDARAASAAAGYLPASTLLLLALPDPGHTAEQWKTTDLYKIWTEPQVQAFLGKPLSKLPAYDKKFNDDLVRLWRLNPRNLFVALASLDEKTNQPRFVAGFRFDGPSAEVDKLLAEPKSAVRQKFPAGKADLINYQGHAIESFDAGEGNALTSVYAGQQYLVANDLVLLKTTLDRLDGRAPAGGDATTLDKDTDFQTVSAKLPSDHATLLFARPRPFFTKVYDLVTASGQTVDPAQRAEAEKIRAVGATTSIDQGKLRDTVYLLAPGYKRAPGTLALSGLPLSSTDTVLYFASLLNIPDHLDPAVTSPTGAPGTPGLDTYRAFFKGFEQQGITLEKFRAAFGNEGGLLLDWPAGGGQPSLLAHLDVRDKKVADQLADSLAVALADMGQWRTAQADGLTLHILSLPSMPLVSPAFAVTDKHLVFAGSEAGVRAAAEREKAGGANFTTSQPYKDSVATVVKGNAGFGYLDAKALFERAYGTLKPMAALSSLMYPQAGDYVDLRKLPDAEVISKHLSPIVYSQRLEDQGVLVESTGPVTFIQAGAGLGVTAGAAALPMLQKQFGGVLGKSPGDEDAPDETPEPTPGASPDTTPAATP